MSGPDAIDPAAHERLLKWGGDKLLGEMVRLFLDNVDERMDRIAEGFRSGDPRIVEEATHSLKSAAANVGVRRLNLLAEELETRASGGGLDGADDLHEELRRARAEGVARLQEMFPPTPPEPRAMNARIAVVEDNPDNRLLVQALLEDHYEISEFETGQEAMEGLVADGPDLILLDISLPEMDGTEVLAWIREQDGLRDTPVVALTAHAMAGDRERFLAEGFDDYLTKPIVDESILLNTLERWLSQTGNG